MARQKAKEDVFTLPRLRVFTTLVDEAGWKRASTALNISATAVHNHVDALKAHFDDQDLVTAVGAQLKTTPLGDEVYDYAKRILHLGAEISELGPKHKPDRTIAFLPHHSVVVARLLAALDANTEFELHATVLGEHHRSLPVFQRSVVGAVSAGVYDVVLGPPAESLGDDLSQVLMYRTHMVALVEDDGRESIAAEELAHHKLLLPPPDTRAGSAIRKAVAPYLPAGVSPDIRLSAHGTKALAIFGMEGLGTVVVPGDIAHAFGPGGVLNGMPFQAKKWVRVTSESEPTQLALKHDVYATTRLAASKRDDAVQRVLSELKSAVSSCFAESDHVILGTALNAGR